MVIWTTAVSSPCGFFLHHTVFRFASPTTLFLEQQLFLHHVAFVFVFITLCFHLWAPPHCWSLISHIRNSAHPTKSHTAFSEPFLVLSILLNHWLHYQLNFLPCQQMSINKNGVSTSVRKMQVVSLVLLKKNQIGCGARLGGSENYTY